MHQYILIKNLIDKHKKKLRSSRPGVLRKKDTSKFLANPTEKHSFQCVSRNNVKTLFKKGPHHRHPRIHIHLHPHFHPPELLWTIPSAT